jgi:hypothetical protein
MADDALALGLAAWEKDAAFVGGPWALLACATCRCLQVPQLQLSFVLTGVFLPG